MGTRYEDQPAEHWAGPESLDPTPVWKQYLLIALLVLGSLVLVGVVASFALAVELATPPAVVPGGRVVLARADLPAVGPVARLVGAPLVDQEHTFWLAQPARGDIVALRATWQPDGGPACEVTRPQGLSTTTYYVARCAGTSPSSLGPPSFGPHGEPVTAPRGLDRYLVSIEGDRIVVNVSRVIRGYGATPQPIQPALTPYR